MSRQSRCQTEHNTLTRRSCTQTASEWLADWRSTTYCTLNKQTMTDKNVLPMVLAKVNANGVKLKIPQGMVTISGPYADGLRQLPIGQQLGMMLAIAVPVSAAKKSVSVDDDNDDVHSSESESAPSLSLGGANPRQGE